MLERVDLGNILLVCEKSDNEGAYREAWKRLGSLWGNVLRSIQSLHFIDISYSAYTPFFDGIVSGLDNIFFPSLTELHIDLLYHWWRVSCHMANVVKCAPLLKILKLENAVQHKEGEGVTENCGEDAIAAWSEAFSCATHLQEQCE